jgi:hypothetical protein
VCGLELPEGPESQSFEASAMELDRWRAKTAAVDRLYGNRLSLPDIFQARASHRPAVRKNGLVFSDVFRRPVIVCPS